MAQDGDHDHDRVNLTDDSGVPMRPMKNTLVLSFSFFAIYTAFFGILDLQSSINQKVGLGVISLSCVYGTRIVSSVLSPLYIHFVGLKRAFVTAFIGHCVYITSNFYPTWWTLIPSSIFLGLNLSPLWISCHLYVNGMSQYNSQANEEDLHGSLSKLNGIFFSLFSFAQVTGNFISSVILHQSSTDQSDLNQTKICGADDCPGDETRTTEIVRPETVVIDTLLGVYLACGLMGLGATAIFLRPLRLENSDKKSLKKKITVCFTVFKDKKLLMLIPLSLGQAFNHFILHTGYTKAFVSCSVGVKMVGFIMMAHGVASALSSCGFGYLAKYAKRIPLVALAFTVDIVMLGVLMGWKPGTGETYLLFVIPCVWAIVDGVWSTQIVALIAMAFPNDQPGVFANLGTWACVGFTAVLVTDRFLCLRTKFYISVLLWTMAVLGYIILELRLSAESKECQTAKYSKFEDEVQKEEVQLGCEQEVREDQGDK